MMEKNEGLVHGGDVYSKRKLRYADRIVDFSANISPLGMPQAVKDAIVAHIEEYECYPDPLCRELTAALAKAHGVDPAWIICGNGAADVIFRLVLASKPKTALLLAPTFAEYEQALRVVDCAVAYHDLPRENGFVLDASILDKITQKLDILFLCNPNNPTGAVTEKELLLSIVERCKSCGVLLVVDECFMDFLETEESLVDVLADCGNLVILKAFTKMYAMAGIRLGYALGSDQALLQAMRCAGQPWSVSTVASKCGVAALSCADHVQKTKQVVAHNRAYLTAQLRTLGFIVYPAQANYLLFFSSDPKLGEKLEEYGILIRACANYRGLDAHFFRIAVKAERENAYLVECLKKLGSQ